jgi:hypothetical protein
MLQQQNLTEQQEEAANVRLTMDELARAVSRYETRKMAEAQVPPDTMTIGEAIEQLSLTADPEELLAEVERERKRVEEEARLKNPPWKEQQKQQAVTPKTRTMRPGLALLGAVLGVSLMMNLVLFVSNIEARRWVAFPPTPVDAMAAPFGMTTPVSIMEDAVPLISLQDGQTAYANLDTINQLANGKSAEETFVHTQREHTGKMWNSEWMLVKLNGQWYIRGWATPDTQFASNTRKYNFLSHNPDGGSGYTTRTVPLDKFKNILDPTFIDETSKVRGVFIPE